MATPWDIRPNEPIVSSSITIVGGDANAWQAIDDDPDSPDLSNYIYDSGSTNGELIIGMSDTPADFVSMDSPMTVRAITESVGFTDDSDTLTVQITDSSGTALTDSVTLSTQADTTQALRTATLTLNATGSAANKATWDAARLRMLWTYGQNMGKDNGSIRVYALEVESTYTAQAPPTTAPTLSLESASETSLTTSWTTVADATSYELERDSAIVYSGAATTFEDTGLTANTSYNYRIRAVNNDGPGPWSAVQTFTTSEVLLAPDTAPVVTAQIGETSFTVNWDPVERATDYIVRVDGAAYATTSTQFVYGSAVPGQTYEVTVTAENSSGSGPTSDPLSIKIPKQPETTSEILASYTNDNSLYLSWDAIIDADNYELERDSVIVYDGPQPSFVDTGLTGGTSYSYRMRGYSSAGYGPWSEIFSASPKLSSVFSTQTFEDGTGDWFPSDKWGTSTHDVTFDVIGGRGYISNVTQATDSGPQGRGRVESASGWILVGPFRLTGNIRCDNYETSYRYGIIGFNASTLYIAGMASNGFDILLRFDHTNTFETNDVQLRRRDSSTGVTTTLATSNDVFSSIDQTRYYELISIGGHILLWLWSDDVPKTVEPQFKVFDDHRTEGQMAFGYLDQTGATGVYNNHSVSHGDIVINNVESSVTQPAPVLNAADVGDDTVSLNWTTTGVYGDSDTFILERDTVEIDNSTIYLRSFFIDEGLTPETTYTYRVRAPDSDWSNEVQVTTKATIPSHSALVDFSGDTNGSIPQGWNLISAGEEGEVTAEIIENARYAGSKALWLRTAARSELNYTPGDMVRDVEVTARVRTIMLADDVGVGIGARVLSSPTNHLATINGVFLYISSIAGVMSAQVYRYINSSRGTLGTYTVPAEVAPATLNDWVNFKMLVQGTTASVKVWKETIDEPVDWLASVEHPITHPGYVSLSNIFNVEVAEFDAVSVSTKGATHNVLPALPPDTRRPPPDDPVINLSQQGSDVVVSWDIVNDVHGYQVYRDNALIGETSETNFVDTSPPPASYVYSVKSYRRNP